MKYLKNKKLFGNIKDMKTLNKNLNISIDNSDTIKYKIKFIEK